MAETRQLISRANQWAGFYTKGTSVMKELIRSLRIRDTCCNDDAALSKSRKSQRVLVPEVTKFALHNDIKMVEIAREIDLFTIFASNMHC